MRIQTAIWAIGLSLCMISGAHGEVQKWDLECRYNNGSIAFLLNLANHKSLGDMIAHQQQVAITNSEIKFNVVASETTLLQDFVVTIDRLSLKWSTNKPGWGGTCRKL
jgi:hypothetical protein